jgi:hypothetical protein
VAVELDMVNKEGFHRMKKRHRELNTKNQESMLRRTPENSGFI